LEDKAEKKVKQEYGEEREAVFRKEKEVNIHNF